MCRLYLKIEACSSDEVDEDSGDEREDGNRCSDEAGAEGKFHAKHFEQHECHQAMRHTQ